MVVARRWFSDSRRGWHRTNSRRNCKNLMLQIGDIRIHLLNDGTVHVDGGGPFGLVPRTLWSRYLPPDDENLVPMILNSLLVQVGGRNLLVDAGIGDKLNEKQRRDIWHLSRTNGTLLDGLT